MQRRDIPLWLVLPPLLGVTAVVSSPAPSRLYAALLSTGAYALMQVLLPECRFVKERYLCPLNWAMLLFLVKLVVVPSIVMLDHPSQGVLPFPAERASMERALLVETAAFVAFCLAVRFVPARPPRSGLLTSAVALLETTPSLGMAALFACLGVVGFLAAFGNIGNLVEYFTNPTILAGRLQEMEGSWRGLGSTVLRPFLAFALILPWCRGVDLYARASGRMRQTLATAAVACGIVLANLTFSFNRASFLFPLVSLTAVFIAKVRRISPVTLGLLGVFAVAPLLAVGAYRAGTRPANEVFQDRSVLSASDLSEEFQVYACAPQFLGYFLEQTGWGKTLYWGSTLIGSALHPVPLLGKGFRDSSGVAIYNRAIYGDTGTEDQIVPFQGELFVNFHLYCK